MEMKKYKLGEICDIFGRIGFRGYTVKDLVPKGNGAITFSPADITDHKISFDNCDYISWEKYEESPEIQVFDGDILFTKTGSTFGKCAFISGLKEKATINPQFVVLKNFKCDNRYLYYVIRSKWFQKNISNIVVGSTIPTMSQEDLRKQEVFLPDIHTQQKISEVLSALDDKIALNRRLNAKLEQMAKRLYDHWFVQFDFPNENGKPYKSSGGKMVWNEELKREIPEGWEVGKLSDIANITMGQSPDGSSYNEDGDGTIFYQGSTDFGIRFPTIRMYTTEPTRFAKLGDILMSVRAPVGTLNIANQNCCIGRGLAALNSKIGSIVHLWFTMEIFKQRFDRKNSSGTTFGAITKDELYTLPVVILPKKIISLFNDKTLSIFNYQLSIFKEIQKLTVLRDRLLQLLMNGQVEVR
ncbi:restriction endonuclease subunit S [uncultured Treponema sp.]|uniref:restriction endonuclease subunit S n=1 Tax=uncultured Treponema sp. TaxID=162155 RepID=UPI0025914E9B|nr:restriction endonuclease subunit S [uncultured Treponema sp.]